MSFNMDEVHGLRKVITYRGFTITVAGSTNGLEISKYWVDTVLSSLRKQTALDSYDAVVDKRPLITESFGLEGVNKLCGENLFFSSFIIDHKRDLVYYIGTGSPIPTTYVLSEVGFLADGSGANAAYFAHTNGCSTDEVLKFTAEFGSDVGGGYTVRHLDGSNKYHLPKFLIGRSDTYKKTVRKWKRNNLIKQLNSVLNYKLW